ncbi:MAG: hypothetical protein HY649_09610 [Acidobacteria bacterium]|nr:hypothetical protein [Acidobacteriota bacterium]
MKHRFLLDENILHHAVKGVDAQDNPDQTATELVLTLAKNCHRIVVNGGELLSRYHRHVQTLSKVRAPALAPIFFVRELLHKLEKCELEYDDPPELPLGITIPEEDKHIVRAALVSRPFVVANDQDLVEAINNQRTLELRALTAQQAIVLASET